MSLTAIGFESSEFDAVAENYEEALQRGLKVSGESSEYFAVARTERVAVRLKQLGRSVRGGIAIDFGCGTGNAIPHLLSVLGCASVIGLDPSVQSLRVARRMHPEPKIEFATPDAYGVIGEADLVFCNGVFHHIAPADRPAVVRRIRELLRPGGIFAYWENNPWNPGTRYIMKRIPFDRDAIPLSIPESRRLLKAEGFELRGVETCFYFPRMLRWLRVLESCLCRLPLGAQYLCLAQKPV